MPPYMDAAIYDSNQLVTCCTDGLCNTLRIDDLLSTEAIRIELLRRLPTEHLEQLLQCWLLTLCLEERRQCHAARFREEDTAKLIIYILRKSDVSINELQKALAGIKVFGGPQLEIVEDLLRFEEHERRFKAGELGGDTEIIIPQIYLPTDTPSFPLTYPAQLFQQQGTWIIEDPIDSTQRLIFQYQEERIAYNLIQYIEPHKKELYPYKNAQRFPPWWPTRVPYRRPEKLKKEARQQAVYRSVCNYLEPSGEAAERLFSPRLTLEELGQRFSKRAISSEQDLESYERFGVEDYVHDIITELCKIPAARDEFHLDDGVWFDNHANALDPVEVDPFQVTEPILLTTVEYKPPHKLSVKNLRAGLQSMDFWDKVVQSNSVSTDEPEKLRYNATRLTGSAVVPEFHVMIQEGLEYSYLTNGLALVML
ncbi:hypothetical protein BBP40_003091 [Aspergillus hancockii]|nr:hypothetical protein BBP40_003091 [Aspergillus hancockii]